MPTTTRWRWRQTDGYRIAQLTGLSPGVKLIAGRGLTWSVTSLYKRSRLPRSSSKDTRTLIIFPRSAEVSRYDWDVTPEIFLVEQDTRYHW